MKTPLQHTPIRPWHLLVAAGVAVLGGVLWGVARTAQTARALSLKFLPKITRLDFDRVELELDVALDNPTNGAITVRDLRLHLFHGGAELLVVPVPGTITVPARFRGRLSSEDVYGQPIRAAIPYRSVFELAPALFRAFFRGGPAAVLEIKAPLRVSSPTMVETAYTHTELIKLGGPG